MTSPAPSGHPCPGGCGNLAEPDAFCCGGCWSLLSPAMRRRVLRVMNAPRLTTTGEAELVVATRAIRRKRR